ncbi:hypothetical protein AB0M39_14045 [Streptomyces sp. NPDC051907]|uniref:hypothetical protein n=1 Tax=Streptomyces sp. NPDC051907 TaxID=3155284 RepID=UPI00344A52FA
MQGARRAAGIVALAVVCLFATAPSSPAVDIEPAAASIDNIVPTSNYYVGCLGGEANGTVCRTDNADVSYYMDSGGDNKLENDDKRIVRSLLASEYAPTDLSITYDSTPTWSGSSETDIYYSEGNVPGSADGIAFCNDASPGNYKCDQQYVRIQGGGSYTPGLSCHETGHAVGLLHGNRAYPAVGMQDARLGCMKKSVGYDQPLGSNQKSNINIVY